MPQHIAVSSGGGVNSWLSSVSLFCSLHREAPGKLSSFFHQDLAVLRHSGVGNPKPLVSQGEAFAPGQTQPNDIN